MNLKSKLSWVHLPYFSSTLLGALALFLFFGAVLLTKPTIFKAPEVYVEAPIGALIVCPVGSLEADCNYFDSTGIQQAIDDVEDGGTVFIRNGLYNNVEVKIGFEGHPVKQNIVIAGESVENTVLDGGGQSGPPTTFGAITIRGASKVTIKRLTIKNSQTNGIALMDTSFTEIIGNVIKDNLDSGILVTNNAYTEIKNNIFFNNNAGGGGGGISAKQNSPSPIKIVNNTFYLNGGGGIYLSYAPYVDVKNNIITGGRDLGGFDAGYGIYEDHWEPNDPSATLSLSYTIFWNNDAECYSENESLCIRDDNINPLFFNSSSDFHLQSGSPAIDTGDPDATYNDPNGSRNDMGAYGGPDACILDPVLPGCPEIFSSPSPSPSPSPEASPSPSPSLSPEVSPSPSPSPSLSPSPAPRHAITLKIRFDGVPANDNEMNLPGNNYQQNVRIVAERLEDRMAFFADYVDFNYIGGGIWEATIYW